MDVATDLSKRMERLERQNQTLTRGLCGLLAATTLVLIAGAVPSATDESTFGTIEAKKVVITDGDGTERIVLELDAGEPVLTMLNHDGMRQVYLGIDESWNDSAYLSLSSRLENGSIDKQALLVATQTRTEGAAGFRQQILPGNAQLLLYDRVPKQKNAAGPHLMRLSSGRLDQLKPYFEIREFKSSPDSQLDYDLLGAGPSDTGQRFLLNTTTEKTSVSGVE